MRRKMLVFSVFFLLFSGLVLGQSYSHDEKMYFGEQEEIGDYIVEYSSQNGDDVLEIGRWMDTSFRIMDQVENDDIYEREGETLNISENLSIRIGSSGWDRDGRFLNLDIMADKEILSSGEIDSSAPSKIIVSQDDSADIPFTIENTGFLNQTYNLSVDTNASVEASFSFQDFNVTEVYVEAGEEESVTANLEVPENAELGTYKVRLIAQNGEKLSEEFQMEIRGAEVEREMSLNIRENYMASNPDETKEIPITVRNSAGFGYRDDSTGAALENVEIEVTAPDSWEYDLNPEGFSELDTRERQRSMLTLDVPAEASPGDYFVEISASSDKASIESPSEIRINVREESGMSSVGLVLMALSLAALIFVYRKFSRR
ncbi:NEW3 domain-containing protein [Candidatus Nanosalina sp. VS9-1]|uniref:COG1470 family protein n=1 Tax=Candidatus Nanosalina sp. VS9-1 TaxID=3388566 RepID=UPI0039E0118A